MQVAGAMATLNSVHENIVVVSWEQLADGDGWVEYSVDAGVWLRSPREALSVGTQSELLLETDDDVQGFVHGSWEEWCEQRQKSSSWQISLSVLRQDGRIAHLGSTHAARPAASCARPTD